MTLNEFEGWLKQSNIRLDYNQDMHVIVAITLRAVEPKEDRDFLTMKYSEYLT